MLSSVRPSLRTRRRGHSDRLDGQGHPNAEEQKGAAGEFPSRTTGGNHLGDQQV